MNNIKSTNKQKIRGWGTLHDYQKKVPSKFVGLSFQEASHVDIENFNVMSNDEKWQMAFWIEHQSIKKSFKTGIIIGVIIGLITILLLK